MSESYYVEVVSGRKSGVLASALRWGLTVCEPFYSLATRLRNRLFDYRMKPSQSVGIPVISVGNITTGGTGKTPTVHWLVTWLTQQGQTPGILSRGYRSLDGVANDEKLLLDLLCREVPHIQNRDRCVGASQLQDEFSCDVIVLDDGFQHRRLARDVDIVLIDALNPWGYSHLLPRGLLRESLSELRRAQAILITRCDLVTQQRLSEIEARLQEYTSAPILRTEFQAIGLVNANGQSIPFSQLNGKRTCSFTGIGNPGGFRRTLASVGLTVSEDRFKVFPDHHHYTSQDLKAIQQWAQQHFAECLVVTRKDLVKINSDKIGALPVWAVEIELNILSDQAVLTELIQAKMRDS